MGEDVKLTQADTHARAYKKRADEVLLKRGLGKRTSLDVKGKSKSEIFGMLKATQAAR